MPYCNKCNTTHDKDKPCTKKEPPKDDGKTCYEKVKKITDAEFKK